MPIYDYRCKKCKKDFELLLFSSDKPACPHCSSKKLELFPPLFRAHCSGKSSTSSSSGGCSCSNCSPGKNCSTCR